jgi:nucleoside-diphosphate-sugar epimerase
MRILVAGGAGYIGSRLVPSLIEHGYEVDVIDALWFGNYLPSDVRVIRRDLFSCGCSDLEGYEQVIFLAGVSNDPMAEYDPAENFVQNGALPAYLAFTAKKARVRRFIYASSCSIYGYTEDQLYDEDGPLACGYPYGIAKLQGERAALQMADPDFSVIAVRQGTVCGWSPRMRFDLIVNTMYKTAMSGGMITVNNASIWRPILDIRDATSAFTRSVQASYAVSGAFNVASGNFTVGQVADYVKDEIEERTSQRIRMNILAVSDFRNYKVSCERARVELGYHPQYSIRDIVIDLHRHADTYGDFERDEYYNVRTFKALSAQRREIATWNLGASPVGAPGSPASSSER